MRKTILLMIISLFVLMGMGCEKEDPYAPPADPQKAILGKWEMIERGIGGVTEPYQASRYIEYLGDSTMVYFYYETNEYAISEGIYWIDTLLHHGSHDKTIDIQYTYKFHEDKMKLRYVDMFATFDTFIYQRKK